YRGQLRDEPSTQPRLTRAGCAVHDDECGFAPWIRERNGRLQIGAGALAMFDCLGSLLQRDELDFRTYERAVDDVAGQECDARIVAGALQVAIEQRRREVAALLGDEIHRKERNIVDHVAEAQLRVELDAVERHERTSPANDIPAMQVAVALADETVTLARIQPPGILRTHRFGPMLEASHVRLIANGVDSPRQARDILASLTDESLRSAAVGRVERRRTSMKVRDAVRERGEIRLVHGVGAQQRIELVARIELP